MYVIFNSQIYITLEYVVWDNDPSIIQNIPHIESIL